MKKITKCENMKTKFLKNEFMHDDHKYNDYRKLKDWEEQRKSFEINNSV